MKICIVSLHTEEVADLAQHTCRNHKFYADLHGYDYIAFKGRFSFRFPPWDKLKAVETVLPKYDYVLWIDADCLIKDIKRKLETFITGKHAGHFAMDPTDYIYANTGVFILKNDPWSFSILEKAWDRQAPMHEKIDSRSYSDWPFEQGPMCELLKLDNQKNHTLGPKNILNCHPNYESDAAFIVHFMGFRHHDYSNTIARILNHNVQTGAVNSEVEYEILPKMSLVDSPIAYEKTISVRHADIAGSIFFTIRKNGVLSFQYTLPTGRNLSHAFKFNESICNFNSNPTGMCMVPEKFSLYHSYEWYGETNFQFVDTISLI